MKVQLPCRWSDHKRPTDKGDDYLKRIIKGEEPGEDDDIEFMYGSVVLDTKDIRAYNDLDPEHCILRTYYNDSYCIALGLEELKQVMVELTAEHITIIKRMEKESPKTKRKPKKSDDDDLII